MHKLSTLNKLTTSLALVVVFLIALAVHANYNVYVWRETGGPALGPWYQYVGTVGSPLGGNIAVNMTGTMILDNRTSDGVPTTIYYNPPSGNCTIGGMRVPCKNEF
jgi:hypothetical protein